MHKLPLNPPDRVEGLYTFKMLIIFALLEMRARPVHGNTMKISSPQLPGDYRRLCLLSGSYCSVPAEMHIASKSP